MLSGNCHCQAVSWKYPLVLESVTACNCTLCRRYGALWAYGYLQDGIQISGPTKKYERGSRINGYHFCTECGCLAYYLSNSEDQQGRRRIAVNLRMIDNPQAILNLPIDHFEGFEKFEDEPRDGRTVQSMWY